MNRTVDATKKGINSNSVQLRSDCLKLGSIMGGLFGVHQTLLRDMSVVSIATRCLFTKNSVSAPTADLTTIPTLLATTGHDMITDALLAGPRCVQQPTYFQIFLAML